MKTLQYLVRINRDRGSDWGASVPDLPGCVATGKTIDSALRRIERAIELHLRGMREDGLRIPRPSHRTVTPRRRTRDIDFYATVEIAASPRAAPDGRGVRSGERPRVSAVVSRARQNQRIAETGSAE